MKTDREIFLNEIEDIFRDNWGVNLNSEEKSFILKVIKLLIKGFNQ